MKLGFIELLERSAEVLEHEAQCLRECHTIRGRWNGEREAKAAHDGLRDLAKQLRKAAKYHKPNPFGGPARIFDACADAIRAGDSVKQAMSDYGLAFVKGKKNG